MPRYSAAKTEVARKLSTSKYRYSSIFPTALSQLDHIFFVIGNGMSFEQKEGVYFQNYCIEMAKSERNIKIERCHEQMRKLRDIVEDAGSRFDNIYLEEIKELEQDYVQMPASYYFDADAMAAEQISYNETAQYKLTPYPVCEYSIITHVNHKSNKTTLALAIACTKGWLKVVQHELNVEQNEEQKTIIEKWIVFFNETIERLENKNA
ncbi:hypothetical protein [Yersinia phage fHe-Yen9-04]|uniref:Uncharacterized protein n=1 Tax=Yersinia phage fHe-Yen9-04 TaxID=2052742 RepID=A0A2C9CZG5_9CAUD|nr:hypothetical protein FDJ41_gp412 [Yersinia phage fHe-Yen9-04]SOK58768.1 hypothetical protein [Yersinia phage fHe-Yen9-04]VUE36537.1 hypothetical protein [Yersinia phage fHe-Yen9-04]